MLHYEAIETQTLELLNQLIKVEEFSGLRLVGGTALALHIGHRKSVDLDLFGSIKSDKITIFNILSSLGKTKIISETENIHVFNVGKIKVDIVNYPYPWLEEKIVKDNIPLAGIKDIAAMKLAAITGRGSKKDFFDLFFLLNHFSLRDLLHFYQEKYEDGSPFLVLKSLAYFADAELDPDPLLIEPISWDKVKTSIMKGLNNYFAAQ